MKYSVIIPIYNAENTLRRCLDSLLPQLNEKIEVLLINDGSKDASGDICTEDATKSPCFRCYTQENAGVSAARNKGLDLTRGEYILFIDSDDYVSADTFSLIDQALDGYAYDYTVFSLTKVNGDEESVILHKPFCSDKPDKVFPKISELICNKGINAPHARLYKRRILEENHIRFPEGCSISEDRAFNIAYSLHITSLSITDARYYYLDVSNTQSLSRTVRSVEEYGHQFVLERQAIDNAFAGCTLEEIHLSQIRSADNFCRCRQVYSRAKRMKLRGSEKKEILAGIRRDCAEINGQKLTYPHTRFCRMICTPVQLRLYRLIYLVAMKLAGNSE